MIRYLHFFVKTRVVRIPRILRNLQDNLFDTCAHYLVPSVFLWVVSGRERKGAAVVWVSQIGFS